MAKVKLKEFTVFIKYAMVGVTGTALDVGSLYVFVDLLHIPVLVAAALSFILAVVNNFILNKIWTFRNSSRNFRKQFIKFFIVSVVGLVLTEICMAVFVYLLGIWYIASKLITSVIVLTWNFLANKNWTFTEKIRPLPTAEQYDYTLTIVIPAFNEAKRIVNTLEAIHRYFERKGMKREIIVVDDGSSDDTAAVVNALKARIHDLHCVSYLPNRGKGYAVKKGVEKSRGEYILFTDADNSTPIESFEKFYPLLYHTKVVIGSRYMADSNVKIKQPKYRILLGRLGNFLIQVLLFDDIRDTQCGFKAFQHSAAKELFSRMKVNRFGFDIELLSIAYLLKYSVREVPVSWYNSPVSRVRPIKDTLRTFSELLYIKLNLLSGRYE
ncbi:MAG TPA: glycosyltransferase [Nitrospirota bacterium]|nr:glycosyltransferase [Nitrospirota bacterium]